MLLLASQCRMGRALSAKSGPAPGVYVLLSVVPVPLGRVGQPEEVAPSFVFLASDDSSYMTGQVLHPNGGSVVNA